MKKPLYECINCGHPNDQDEMCVECGCTEFDVISHSILYKEKGQEQKYFCSVCREGKVNNPGDKCQDCLLNNF